MEHFSFALQDSRKKRKLLNAFTLFQTADYASARSTAGAIGRLRHYKEDQNYRGRPYGYGSLELIDVACLDQIATFPRF